MKSQTTLYHPDKIQGTRRESCRDIPDGSVCRIGQVTSSGDFSALFYRESGQRVQQKHGDIKLVCSKGGEGERGDNAEGFKDESLPSIKGAELKALGF